jgi:hypothetical protein
VGRRTGPSRSRRLSGAGVPAAIPAARPGPGAALSGPSDAAEAGSEPESAAAAAASVTVAPPACGSC